MRRPKSLTILVILLVCCVCLVFCDSCSIRRATVPYERTPYSDAFEAVLNKPDLKVLDIGNSYTNDALDLLPTVVQNCGVDVSDMSLYKLIRGGASFKNWCDVYEDNDPNSYYLKHVVGSQLPEFIYQETAMGNGSLFRRILSDVEWDLIIIHQVSNFAPYYDLWEEDGNAGCLDKLLGIIQENQPNAQIGFLLVHSYWDGFSGNQEESSLKRWRKIADSAKRLQKDYRIEFVIPYGTAVENLRSSSLNNSFDLTADGTHCGYGLCKYTAACCYYESLIAPRTAISCYGTPADIDVSDRESLYPGVNVDSTNALTAQKAAILAVQDMFHCNNPEKE